MAKSASVRMMLTKDMKQQLADLGYTSKVWRNFTPEEAASKIESGVKYVTQDVIKENASHFVSTDTRNEVIKNEQKKPRQTPHKDLSQKKKRKRKASRCRSAKKIDLDSKPVTYAKEEKRTRPRTRLQSDGTAVQSWNNNKEKKLGIAGKDVDTKIPPRSLKKDFWKLGSDVKQTFKNWYSTSKSPMTESLKGFAKNKWVKRSAKVTLGLLATQFALGAARHTFFPKPAIPEEYERGYDVIDQTMTDFGSPLHLAKAAHKSIRPYYSTVRSALRTNVNTVMNRNAALLSSKSAIGHTRY